MILAWVLATWIAWSGWMPPGHFPLVGIAGYAVVVEEWATIEYDGRLPLVPHVEVMTVVCDDIPDEHQCGLSRVWAWR